MEHDVQDSMKGSWSTSKLQCTPSQGKVIKCDRFCMSGKCFTLKIIKIHLTERILISTGCGKAGKFSTTTRYHPSEELALNEVLVKYMGTIMFRQCIPEKRKQFEIKLFKTWDDNGHRYDMEVYWEKLLLYVVSNIIPNHGRIMLLTKKVEGGAGQRLFMDNWFSSPQLCPGLHHGKINRQGMTTNFGPNALKLKKGYNICNVLGCTRAVCWKDQTEI
jgi:hypothetical protein